MWTNALAAPTWGLGGLQHLGVPLVQPIPHMAGVPQTWSGGVSSCEECRKPLSKHRSKVHGLLSVLSSQLCWYWKC